MSAKFGTSGLRGLASQLIGETARSYIAGFLLHLLDQGIVTQGGSICVGWDHRDSSPALLSDVAAVVSNFGLRLILCGTVPTPALAYYSMGRRLASIMITGSHIPADRNGIKFYLPNGEITKSDEHAISNFAKRPLAHRHPPSSPFPPEDASTVCEADFIRRYETVFGRNTLSGLTVGMYQHSTVARDLMVEVLENAGATVIALDRSKEFVPIDTEAVSRQTHVKLRQWSKSWVFDAIVSADGDGDRPLLADENGHVVRGDVIGLMTARYLRAETVVSPITSTTGLDLVLGRPVRRTRVGSPFVIEEMQKAFTHGEIGIVGFEANGGFLTASAFEMNGAVLDALPTRDCFLPILAVLASAKSGQCTVSELVRSFKLPESRGDRLENFPIETSVKLMTYLQSSQENLSRFFAPAGRVKTINTLDGLRVDLTCGSVVHLRPSGNAPEFRCYVEALTSSEADGLLSWGLSALSTYAEQPNSF